MCFFFITSPEGTHVRCSEYMLLCRLQRFAMLESSGFHKQLLSAACGHDDALAGGNTCKEHRQQLALDILGWIVAIYMNDNSIW